MANNFVFTEEEIEVDQCLGHPKAYANLARDLSFGPLNHDPPFTFTPYPLDSRVKELDEMFPIIYQKEKPTTNPEIFTSLLWKQLNHLGNAGFDPEVIRVDPYGNVVYYHADAASPLAWDIDHWFPCSRGGLTVPNNLRILQWQVCKRKHNKLKFLIPWMASNFVFTEEEMEVDQCLGHPKAYANLARDRSFGPLNHGPPFTFTPYPLDSRVKELDEMFPIIYQKEKPTTNPEIFTTLLWKQLNHLGNAGFDPEVIRVDPYGNVVYYHADAASPLAWDIDHWFPCSRGGLTVPNNLRILQWQVCKRKHNKLEFLIPWWDFQLGISINQFLSIFASKNSDFRRRAFSWLFLKGGSEELNASQIVDSHVFPQHYLKSKGKLGLAPAAIVLSDAPLKSLDVNLRPRSSTIVAMKKTRQFPDENENAIMATNPHQAIAMARDSLRHRQEKAKMQVEMQKLDNEASELEQRTEEEKVSIQELEHVLVKKRRRAEKCRHLAESQSSYRTMLEKMIRDAMHQSVVYKEQVRLNQAAASALLARLEAQRAICDSAERELHRKYKQRDDIEKQIRPEWEQARKRLRTDDNTLTNERDGAITPLFLPPNEPETLCLSERKELRKFMEEEQNPETENLGEEGKEIINTISIMKPHADDDSNVHIVAERLEKSPIRDSGKIEEEDDEVSRRKRGKGNVEKWLQFLLENNDTQEEEAEVSSQKSTVKNGTTGRDELIKLSKAQEFEKMAEDEENGKTTPLVRRKKANKLSSPGVSFMKEEGVVKERELLRSESARSFRRIPSSPSLMLEGMKKKVKFMMRKKP